MERKHSRFGIFSFLAAVVSIAGMIVCIAATPSIVEHRTPGAGPEALGGLVLIGALMMLFTLTALAGALLGLFGLFQKHRLKLFSVLGLVFNAALVCALLIMVLIGTITGATLPGTFD